MKNSKKFLPLYETIYNRYKNGAGFLEGDLVKLKNGYKGLEEYRSLAETIKVRIEMVEKSGLNLRLGRLHSHSSNIGAFGNNLGLPATHADLYQEMAPGNFGNLMTVPVGILEVVDTGINLPPVAEIQKRPTTSYQDPSELGVELTSKVEGENENPMTDEQSEVARGQHYIHKKRDGHNGDYKLAKKNTKLPVGSNEDDLTKPSTKWKPLKGNRQKPVKLSEGKNERTTLAALTDVYTRILNEDTDIYSQELPGDIDQQGEPFKPNAHNYEIEEHMVKPEHWDKATNQPRHSCWNEDGSFKEECWNMPGSDPVQGDNNAKDPEQTSAY